MANIDKEDVNESIILDLFKHRKISKQLLDKLIVAYNQLVKYRNDIIDATKLFSRDNDNHKINSFLNFEIIQKMFHTDFTTKEVMDTLGNRRLSNASIMHICFQILSQLKSKEINDNISNIVKIDAVRSDMRDNIKKDNNDISDEELVSKTNEQFDLTSKEEIEQKCALDKEEIEQRIEKRIQYMREELIFDMFDIYVDVYDIDTLNKHEYQNSGNIILYNKSYNRGELYNLILKYRNILTPKVTDIRFPRNMAIDHKQRFMWLRKGKYWRLNEKCRNYNTTELWQLCCAVVFHCDEQHDYLYDKYRASQPEIMDATKKLYTSIDKLVDRMNSFCRKIYDKPVTEYMNDFEKPYKERKINEAYVVKRLFKSPAQMARPR